MGKFYKIVFIVILLIVSFSVFSQEKEEKRKPPKYLFKIATELPENSIWIISMKEMGRDLYNKTNQEVGIRIYPSSTMGDQSTVIKKIKLGQLSGCTFSAGGLSLIYNDFAVVGFPLLLKSYEEYDYFKLKMTDYFSKEFEKRNYIFLAWSEVGLIYLYSKNKINSLEGLRNSKPFLVDGDVISLALFNEAKATAVPLQIADVMTGLETGLIDTVFSSPSALILMQWHAKVKYMADFPITLMIGAIMVDKKLFNSMPKNYQTTMKDMFAATFNNLNERVRKDNDNSLNTLKKSGIIALPVTKSEEKKFYDVCENVALKLTEKEYSRELYKTLSKLMEDHRKTSKK